MNIKNMVISSIVIVMLAGCAENYGDLKSWMNDRTAEMSKKIEPLPKLKEYNASVFNANNTLDPFKPRKVTIQLDKDKDKLIPDKNRKKEQLESYPLEQLSMVGIIIKDKITYALIKNKEGTVHEVVIGNYLGQNYGKITKIEEGKIYLTELFQDSDEWIEKKTEVYLQETVKK